MAGVRDHHIVVREMVPADLREVHRIERAAYEDAWPATAFESELRNRFASYVVAVELPAPERHPPSGAHSVAGTLRRLLRRPERPAGRIVGFAGAWLTAGQLHIVTIAVDRHRQGRGIGRRLLLECFAIGREAELTSAALEVRPSNERARQLYQNFGFRDAGRLRAYYKNNNEDAIVMLAKGLLSDETRSRLATLRCELQRRFPHTAWDQPPAAG